MNYNCLYCDARCHQINDYPYTWWGCRVCQVKFRDAYGLELIVFERKLNEDDDKSYRVELHMSEDRTKVICLDRTLNTLAMDWDLIESTILDIDHAITTIRPDNVVNKLRTLLLFL